jgi:hypothetical protein
VNLLYEQAVFKTYCAIMHNYSTNISGSVFLVKKKLAKSVFATRPDHGCQ